MLMYVIGIIDDDVAINLKYRNFFNVTIVDEKEKEDEIRMVQRIMSKYAHTTHIRRELHRILQLLIFFGILDGMEINCREVQGRYL